jgi:hypothetical protein
MAAIPGTVIGAQIVPSDSADTYSTHEDIYGKGGFRSVADLTERDSISTQRRKEGMLVFVTSEVKTYQLQGGITNSDWVLFDSGGSGSVSGEIYEVPFFIGTDTLSGSPNFIYDFDTNVLSISGAVTADEASFESLSLGSTTVVDILDEDDLSSNSNTALATQQSIKAYVDSSTASFDIIESTISPSVTGEDVSTESISGGMTEWNIVISDGTNYRSEKIMTVSDGSTVEFASHTTIDIGNTNDVSFDVVIDLGQTVLRANNAGSTTWTVKLYKNSIPI